MIWSLLFGLAFGQDTKVQVAQEQLSEAADDMGVLLAYIGDKKLVDEGKAPEGWVQPEYAVYAQQETPRSCIPTEELPEPCPVLVLIPVPPVETSETE